MQSKQQRWLERTLLLALALLLFWKGLLPAWKSLNTDFPNYYLVARLLREGYSLDRVYDWIWLQRIKDHWGLAQPLVGFAGLTPFSALPILPLAMFSALTAKRLWIVFNLGLLAASVDLLSRVTTLSKRRVWLIALLAILPLRTSFLYGQMHIAVLFLMALAYFFERRNREWLGGLCIALAGALKIYPLFFLLYFLWKRQWRSVIATIASTVLIVIVGGFTIGWGLLRIYALQMLPRSLQGETLDPYSIHAASAAALLHRLFLFEPALNPFPLFSSPSAYAIAYSLWQIAVLLPLLWLLYPRNGIKEKDPREWGVFLFSLLLLSPVPSSYHFVVMIAPVVFFVDIAMRKGRTLSASLAILFYVLISISGTGPISFFGTRFNTFFAFSRLWFEIALFLVLLIDLYVDRPKATKESAFGQYPLLLLFATCILCTNIAGYRRHFFLRQQEMSHRILPPSQTFLATSPQASDDRYLFVGMEANGYRIFEKTDPVPNISSRADQLSFAVSKDHSLFVEIADTSASRVIRSTDGKILAEDAESPVISEDDDQLGFIRESRGRGSLWAASLSAAQLHSPSLVLGDDYNVLQASFLRSGEFLLLAKHDGIAKLYTVTPGSLPVPFFTSGSDIASFSISPDRRSLVFTELIHNRWQLAVLTLSSGRVKVLTSTDCNAYTPSWSSPSSVIYATDCGRGLGLTALASIPVPPSE